MERKGWILALGAVVLIAVGAGIWWNDAGGSGEAARLDDGEASEHRSGRRSGSAGSHGFGASATGRSGGSRAPAVVVDAGALARVPSGAARPERPEPSDTNDRELPGNAHDNEQSSGWRLGQARRRIAILEPRVARFRANVRTLEEQGRTGPIAERQRAVLERTERRLNELREQERELLVAARADGTVGDAERGFDDGETHAMAEREPIRVDRPEP